MRYVLLVSHGTMAPGVHSVIRMLLGERPDVLSHSMADGVSADRYMEELREVLAVVGADDSVIVLGDIVGGSPLTNALAVLTERALLPKTIALGGLSLPMAISALMALDDGVDDAALVETVTREAREGVRQVVLDLEGDEDEEL
jgi:PTS system N-acetylgalactosamine-specific IIA component